MSGFRAVVAVVLTAILGAAALAAPDGSAVGTTRSRVPGSPDEDLLGAAAATPTSVWAVGFQVGRRSEHALIRHWDGKRWSTSFVFRRRAGIRSVFAGVSADDGGDAWAVGEAFPDGSEHDRAIVAHWDGSQWQPVPVAIEDAKISDLFGVAALSPTDAWAVGSYIADGGGPTLPLVLHWDGRTWRSDSLPSLPPGHGGSLQSVAQCGSDDVWAAGFEGTGVQHASDAYVLHWNGTRWSRVEAPSPGKIIQLRSVSCVTGAVWTVGFRGLNFDPFALEYTGGSWHIIAIPTDQRMLSLSAVSTVSRTSAWIVGTDETGLSQALALHWNGNKLTRAQTDNPNVQDSLDAITGQPGSLWAVGLSATKHSTLPLAEKWDGTRWKAQ